MAPLQRTLAVALVTAEVHNRDVLEVLVKKNVHDSQNFLWQAQLRYVRSVQRSFLHLNLTLFPVCAKCISYSCYSRKLKRQAR